MASAKEQRMLLKVTKDSIRDKSREVCIIFSDNVYLQYALFRNFKDSHISEGEYLVELNYDKNFDSEKPVKFNFMTPNGFLTVGANICIAQGTFHRGSKEFQNNRMIAGYGLVRQLWSICQYLYAIEDNGECNNWKDTGVSGIGWINPSERNPHIAEQYALKSRSFNREKYGHLIDQIYKTFDLKDEPENSEAI